MDKLDKPLAFSDWTDLVRDMCPEAAKQLDIAESYSLELLSLRAKMQELEQKRDAAIASVEWPFEEYQQLLESLIRIAEEDNQDKEVARICFKAATVDDIISKAKNIIEIDKRLDFKGVVNHEDIGLMATGKDSFVIWLEINEHNSLPLFVYQDGVVTKNKMYSHDIAKLNQCHAEAIAWEANFDNWSAQKEAEYRAREAKL